MTGETLRFWFTDAGIDLGIIGLTSLIGTAYTIKFLWAPLVDRIEFGALGRRFGKRRIWLISTQIGIAILIFAMSTFDPAADLAPVIWLAIGVAFLSATQDVAVDAYRIEYLQERQLAGGTATHTAGWYLGARLAGGALALALADLVEWQATYAVMAFLMGVGMLAVIINAEPVRQDSEELRRRREQVRRFLSAHPQFAGPSARLIGFLYVSVISPFLDLWRRHRWALVPLLLLVIFFKFQDAFAGVMTGPFVRGELGFDRTALAGVYKTVGLAAALAGFFVAGLMVSVIGLMRSLWIGAVLQMVSNFGFCWLVIVGRDYGWLAAVNGFENFASGIGNAVFVVFLSRLCSDAYTATQFALLSALALLARTFLAAPAGYLVEFVGWFNFFALSGFSAIPGLLLLWWLSRDRA